MYINERRTLHYNLQGKQGPKDASRRFCTPLRNFVNGHITLLKYLDQIALELILLHRIR
jgi:hypothetical protein